MTSKAWVLQQAIVDIQYERGIVYLDKCGSLMLALEDTLGKPFVGGVPEMSRAELTSPPERLVVTYGPKSFNVSQHWIGTPARVEQVAPIAWEKVSEVLGVARHVKRLGVRFTHVVGADDRAEAEQALGESRFLKLSKDARDLVGEGDCKAVMLVTEGKWGKLRLTLDTVEMSIGPAVPDELAKFVPPHGIAVDIDNVMAGALVSNLTKARLRELILAARQRSRDIVNVVGRELGIDET